MTRSLFLKLIEAIVLRAAPGVVNLAALLLVGSWLSPEDYGVYSTVAATAGFLSNMIFGPLMFAVVSQHAKLSSLGLADKYESSFVSAVLMIGIVVGACGALFAAFGLIGWSWIAPVVALGIYSAVQEVLHARLRIWAYGAAALLQAGLFIGCAWLVVKPQPSVGLALTVFSASYGVAAVASLLYSGVVRLRWPDFKLLSGTAAIGGAYTVGTAIEQAFYLGIRYLVFLVDTPQSLGTFSFCVDLAQRVMGFLLSAVGFVAVPAAFKADAERRRGEFSSKLVFGASVGVALSAASFVALLVIRQLDLAPSLSGSLFDPQVFGVVSLAVVLNRVKKIVLDPVAMRAGRAAAIAVGYAVSAPVALGIGATVFLAAGKKAPEMTYLLGCVLTAAVTAFAVKRTTEER
jgi:O-antigen/teichoic acid export membrane protein